MAIKLRDNHVDSLVTQHVDFHERRITNAGAAVNNGDYVIKSQLDSAIAAISGTQVAAASVSGRVYTLGSNGTLAISSDICPRVLVADATKASSVSVNLKTAPTGASLIVEIFQSTVLWMTLTLVAGSLSVVATNAQVAAATSLVVGNYWRVDILQVGSTYPGADLMVTIST